MDVPAANRTALKARVESYRKQLAEAEAKLRKNSTATGGRYEQARRAPDKAAFLSHPYVGSAARDQLFAYDGTTQDQRESMMTNTDRLSRSTRHLQEGHRVALETQVCCCDVCRVGLGVGFGVRRF